MAIRDKCPIPKMSIATASAAQVPFKMMALESDWCAQVCSFLRGLRVCLHLFEGFFLFPRLGKDHEGNIVFLDRYERANENPCVVSLGREGTQIITCHSISKGMTNKESSCATS